MANKRYPIEDRPLAVGDEVNVVVLGRVWEHKPLVILEILHAGTFGVRAAFVNMPGVGVRMISLRSLVRAVRAPKTIYQGWQLTGQDGRADYYSKPNGDSLEMPRVSWSLADGTE